VRRRGYVGRHRVHDRYADHTARVYVDGDTFTVPLGDPLQWATPFVWLSHLGRAVFVFRVRVG